MNKNNAEVAREIARHLLGEGIRLVREDIFCRVFGTLREESILPMVLPILNRAYPQQEQEGTLADKAFIVDGDYPPDGLVVMLEDAARPLEQAVILLQAFIDRFGEMQYPPAFIEQAREFVENQQ